MSLERRDELRLNLRKCHSMGSFTSRTSRQPKSFGEKLTSSQQRDQLMDEAREILKTEREMCVEEEEPLYGFLMRKTRLSWIQRWCVCSDNSLYISKSPKDHLSVTKVYLPHYSICRSKFEEHKREWVFKIWGEGKKTIFLAAQTKESRENWVKGLRAAARSDEVTPVNTLTKSTIKQITNSLRGLSLSRDRSHTASSNKSRNLSLGPEIWESPPTDRKILKSPSDTEIALNSLAAALEEEFGTGLSSGKNDTGWDNNDTIVLSGTLKKSNKSMLWDQRHYVVIGSILREYITATDEWHQDSIYLPGGKISSICNSSGSPQFILKIEPIARPPVILAAKTRLELNVWEHELTAISRLKPDPEILRDMEPDYVDIEQNPSGSSVSKSVSSNTSSTSSDHHPQARAMTGNHKTPNLSKRFQRGHRRTRSDNTRYFDPSVLRRPAPPLPHSRGGHGAETSHQAPPKPDKKPRAPYSDVVVLPPPPKRPAPTLPASFSTAAYPQPSHSTVRTMPSRVCPLPPPPPPNSTQHGQGFRSSSPQSNYIQSVPIDYSRGNEWPYSRIPNPLEDMLSSHSNSPPQGDVFHSADNYIPRSSSSASRRSQTPGKVRNRATYVYSDSGDDFTDFDDSSFPLRNPFELEKLEFNSCYNLYPPNDGSHNEPTSPLNRRANTPPGTRYHENIPHTFYSNSSNDARNYHYQSTNSQRSRHISADDKVTEGYLEVKEAHHWIIRWVSVRGNIIRIRSGQNDNTISKSIRLTNWTVSSSDEDKKWAILCSKSDTNDWIMLAAQTRESRDKWLNTLSKSCTEDTFGSFRSNSLNGSTITLNSIDRTNDIKEELFFSSLKGYLREKTHVFQWTRRFCFITNHTLYITNNEDDLELLFEIELSTITVTPDSDLKKPYAFKLVSSLFARELYLAAESSGEYDRWVAVLRDKKLPTFTPSQPKSAPKTNPVPPVPMSAQSMKKTAHTAGFLFKYDKREWICCWCARFHSNLMFYESDNSTYPSNSIKLTGADIITDYQHNMYRFLITPAKLDKGFTLGTETLSEFEKWTQSFSTITSIFSRNSTDSSREMRLSDDLCNQSSQEILANSVQSIPVERFTSGYGSGESVNSAGTGVYENYGKHSVSTHRQSSEYEDYVNTPPQRIQIPRREANNLVEQWVDKVHDHLEKEGDSVKSSPLNDNAPSVHSVAVVCSDATDVPQHRNNHAKGDNVVTEHPTGVSISSEEAVKSVADNEPPVHSSNEDNISSNVDAEQPVHTSIEDNINSNIGTEPQDSISKKDNINGIDIEPATHASNEDNINNDSYVYEDNVHKVEPEEKVLNIDLNVDHTSKDEHVKSHFTESSQEQVDEGTNEVDQKTESEAIIPPPPPPMSNSFEDSDSIGDLPPPPEFSNDDSGVGSVVVEQPDISADTTSQAEQVASEDPHRSEISIRDELYKSDLSMVSDREFEMMEREMLEEENLQSKIASQELLVNQNSEFPFEDLGDSIKDDIVSDTISGKRISVSDSTNIAEDKEFAKSVISDDTSDKPASRSSDVTGEESYISNFSSQSASPVPTDPAYRSTVERLTSLDKLETWDDGLEESLKRTSQFLIAAETTHSQASGGYDSSLERSLELGSFDDDSSDVPSPATNTPTKPSSVKSSNSTSKIMKPSGLAMPASRLVTPSSKLRKSASSHTQNNNDSAMQKPSPTTDSKKKTIQSPYGTMPRNKPQTGIKNTKLSRTRHDSSENKNNATPTTATTTLRKNASRDSSRGGIVTPKKTSTLPRPSRIGTPKTGSSGLKIPGETKVTRSRSSSRESVNTADVKGRRDSNSSAKSNDSNEGMRLSRHNPTEKSMRRRLLSGETTKISSKSTLQRHRLAAGGTKGLRGDDTSTSPRRGSNMRSPGLSSLPGSATSSPTPKMTASKPSPRATTTQYGRPKAVDNPATPDPPVKPVKQEVKPAAPSSGLRAPKTSGLAAPKSGLKPPSSGLRKPSSGIPKPR